jgi:hypothetical protein
MAWKRRRGYLVYMVRATVPRRTRRLIRLDNLDDSGMDLLTEAARHVASLGPGLVASSEDEGFRVRECAGTGRALWLRVSQGPRRVPGEVWDDDAQQATDLTEAQSALSELRGMLVVPTGAHFGLLFVERVARRHMREIVKEHVLDPIGLENALLVRSAAFADGADWRRDLAGKQVLRVGQVLKRETTAETPADNPEEAFVDISVQGTALRSRTEALKDRFFRRADRQTERLQALIRASEAADQADAIEHARIADQQIQRATSQRQAATVEEEREISEQLRALEDAERQDVGIGSELAGLIPAEFEGFDHKRWEISFGEVRPERTFVLERDSMPQFLYELGGDRLPDSALRQAWRAHAERIYRDFGDPLPRGWSEGVWTP